MDMASLLPWRRTRLDPARTRATRCTYDEAGNYAAWSAWCRARMRRTAPASPESGLARRGFEVVPVLSAAEAAAMRAAMLLQVSTTQVSKADIDYAELVRFDDPSFLQPLFERVLSPEMDARLVAHFRSEYFIFSSSMNQTRPAGASRRSFLWHCDRGPRDFVKINLFLNATAEHGSTTEFVDRAASAAFERLGYTFGPYRRRVASLAPLARRAGIELRTVHPDVGAGEALLFEPANVLHRGILPTRGMRHMLSLMLAPSPVPWREAWAATARTRAAETNLGRWPSDAEHLFDMIGIVRPPGGLAAQA